MDNNISFEEKVYEPDFNSKLHKRASFISKTIKNGKAIFKMRTLDDKLFYCHIELYNGLAVHVYNDNSIGILYCKKVSKKINGERRFINNQIVVFEDKDTKEFYNTLCEIINNIRYFPKYNEEIDILTLQDICLCYLNNMNIKIKSVPNNKQYPFDKKYN